MSENTKTDSQISRRAIVAGAAGLPGSLQASAAGTLRIGAPVFLKSDDPEELAREHKRLGYAAAYCPAAALADADRLRAIEKAFAAQDIVIAEAGAWSNMLDPDAEKRGKSLALVTERLALADAVGALTCVNIAGSFSKSVWYGPHPGNISQEFFDGTVENCRKVIDAVKPKRTKLSIEMMGWSLPDGPAAYLKLIQAVDRPEFGVHLDVCNGVNSPERFYRNTAFIAECFGTLGRWIVSCHAKDLEWRVEYNVHFAEVVPGRGSIDYATLLREAAKLPQRPPLMLEHLNGQSEYEEGAAYIHKVAGEQGIAIR